MWVASRHNGGPGASPIQGLAVCRPGRPQPWTGGPAGPLAAILGFAEPVCAACGGVDGKQTVAKVELMALVQLAGRTNGDVAVAVDANHVVLGFAEGRMQPHKHHADLWPLLWGLLRMRVGRIVRRTVKAHQEADAEAAGNLSWDQMLNMWADALAGEAARRQEVSPQAIHVLRQADNSTWQIQSRRWRVVECVSENGPPPPSFEQRAEANQTAKARKRAALEAAIRATSHAVGRGEVRRAFLCDAC